MKKPALMLALLLPAAAFAQDRFTRVGATLGDPHPGGFGRASTAQLLARKSIETPARLPFPARTPAYFRSMYEARSNAFFMVGTMFVERLQFHEIDGKVEVVPERGSWRLYRLGQHLGDGLYLVQGADAALDVGDPSIPEGEYVEGLAIESGLYRYVTVTGAARQIQKLKFFEPRPATFEEFGQAVKSGREFKAVAARPIPCITCAGGGKIMVETRTTSGKVRPMTSTCPGCRGAGSVTAPGACLYVWQ